MSFPHSTSFPRRSLFGAAAAVVAGGSVVAAPGAHASASAADEDAGQEPARRSWETDYDHRGNQDNPANQLGCPLGKGV